MSRLFIRETLSKGEGKKKKTEQRVRNFILNFRVSQEEKALIEKRIELSGMSKIEFFVNSCMHQKIVTFGNVKTFDAMRAQLNKIEERLMEIEVIDDLDAELIESLRTILEIFDGLKRGE